MLAKNVAASELQRSAQAVGVRVELNGFKGLFLWFTLSLAEKRENGTKKYQRTSTSWLHEGRRVNAVCFHGYRDFMANLFAAVPDAVLISAKARYEGVGDFNAMAESVGDSNVGSQMYPMGYRDACECGDDGCE